jgi:hypothetical protein
MLNSIEDLAGISPNPHMTQFESPFLAMPVSDWLCSNDLVFADLRRVSRLSRTHPRHRPPNRDYNPIIVTPHEAPEMVVVGEWVSSID